MTHVVQATALITTTITQAKDQPHPFLTPMLVLSQKHQLLRHLIQKLNVEDAAAVRVAGHVAAVAAAVAAANHPKSNIYQYVDCSSYWLSLNASCVPPIPPIHPSYIYLWWTHIFYNVVSYRKISVLPIDA